MRTKRGGCENKDGHRVQKTSCVCYHKMMRYDDEMIRYDDKMIRDDDEIGRYDDKIGGRENEDGHSAKDQLCMLS